MYTQCPNCATVFRVTAEVLRTAQGRVRCGVCATSFDALENLSEEPFSPTEEPAESPSPDDSMTVEELPASEDIELSSANEIQALPDPASTETPEGQGTVAEFDPAEVAAQLTSAGSAAANETPAARPPPPAARIPTAGDPDSTDEYPILVLDERDLPEDAVAEEVVLETAPEPGARTDSPGAYASPRIPIPEDVRQRLAAEAAQAEFAQEFGGHEADPDRPHWPWITATAVLAFLFVAQVVHSARESLVQRPGVGPFLAQIYELFGRPLTMPTDLAAYELRQWGAASDPRQQGRLLLRASIVNRAAYAQPYPLLRLALQDRFGATLGTRDIEPADYLPGESQSSLLGPGERADAEIRIVDPGQEAVGFEMDVCLPAGEGILCASQAQTPAR